MKTFLKFTISAVTGLVIMSSFAFAEFEIHFSNDVSIDNDGWIHPTAGDPYVVFNSNSSNPDDYPVLAVKIAGQYVMNRHVYSEIFWATEQINFSEQYKGFFIIPFSPDKKPITSYLNFGDFIRAIGDGSQHINLVRIDLDPRLSETDFKCQMSLKWMTLKEAEEYNITPIHPPYLSRFLKSDSIIKYSFNYLWKDMLNKFFRDWLFLVLYLGAIGIILILLWMFRKQPLIND